MCAFYDKVVELSQRLTQWSVDSTHRLSSGRKITGVSRYTASKAVNHVTSGLSESPSSGELIHLVDAYGEEHEFRSQSLVICTGGGPGFMEAANKGASLVPGARNMGVNISQIAQIHYS